MNYNDGINFGYDQIFVNPWTDYDRNNKRNKVEMDLIKKIQKLESRDEKNLEKEQNFEQRRLYKKDQDDIAEIDALRRTIFELQRKNDTLIMFIVFLIIFVIMHYNTYNNTPYYFGGIPPSSYPLYANANKSL